MLANYSYHLSGLLLFKLNTPFAFPYCSDIKNVFTGWETPRCGPAFLVGFVLHGIHLGNNCNVVSTSHIPIIQMLELQSSDSALIEVPI